MIVDWQRIETALVKLLRPLSHYGIDQAGDTGDIKIDIDDNVNLTLLAKDLARELEQRS